MVNETPTLDDLQLDDDDIGVEIPDGVTTNEGFDPALCLVGQFLTDRQTGESTHHERTKVIDLETTSRSFNQ